MTTHTRACWYQKHEMLACAARCGFSVTESLFDDWVEKGLIGEAGARARPGRGSRAWWPQAQLTLLLDLLALRPRTPLMPQKFNQFRSRGTKCFGALAHERTMRYS